MVTINYINELKNDAYENRLGKITLNDNTILDQDNNLSSLEIDSGCYIDGSIIGSVYVKKATVSLLGSDISLNGKTFNAQVGVKYEDGTTEYTNLGNYKVTELKDAVTENQLNTVAYDYLMDKIDQPYVCGVDFSSGNKTVKDFYIDVCSQLGLTPVTTTFINSTIPVSANPFNEQTTNRIVLQSIGKVACSYITIDQSTNKINLSWLSTSTTPDYEFDVDDYSTFTGGETTFGPVNKVVIKNSQIDSENISMGTGDNEVVISEDYFLYNATLRQQAITAIYNRLKNLTYVNADLTTYHGKPFLNIGDKIRINYQEITDYDETGEPIYENHVYDTYVLTHTLTYDGTLTSKITSPVPTKQEVSITNDISLGEALRNTQAIVDKQNNKIEFVTQEVEQMGEKIGTSAISITTEYYLSNSRTSLSGGSWSTTISSVPADKYLWTRTKTTYNDTSKQPTYSTAVPITGNQGAQGEQGIQGVPGVQGIPGNDGKTYYTWIKYADSPTSGMSDSPTGKDYIGIASNKTSPTESTTYSDYSWSLIKGEQGIQGNPGATGSDGNGISKIDYYYARTTTSTVPSASSVTGTTIPTLDATNKYLWQKEVITFTKTSTPQTTVLLLAVYGDTGSKGDPGEKGATGRGVKSIVPQYYLSTSNTTQTGGSWSTTQPTWQSGKYIWVRSHITWDDNTTTDTTPQLANFENDIAKKYSDLTIETGQISAKVGTLETNYNKEFTTTGTVDGYPVNITDASATIPKSNIIYGNSVQNGTPTPTAPKPVNNVGLVNLYTGSKDFSGSWFNTSVWEKISETYNDLSVMKRNGAWAGLYKEIEVEAGKTYTFSLYAKADSNRNCSIYLGNGTLPNEYFTPSQGKSVSLTTEWERISLTFTVNGSGTIKPRLEATSTSSTEYIYICGYSLVEGTYTGYIEDGINYLVEKTYGKNLLDLSKYEKSTMNGVTLEPISSNKFRLYGQSSGHSNHYLNFAIPQEWLGKQLTLSCDRKFAGNVGFKGSGDVFVIDTPLTTSKTMTITQYTINNVNVFDIYANQSFNDDIEITIMLNEESSTSGSNTNQIQIDLQGHELCKIGDVKDEYDVNTGILTKRIGKIVLDGSESWTLQSINSYGIANFLYRWASNYPHDEGMISNQISSHFTKQNTIISQTTNMGFLPAYDTNVSQLGAYFRISSTIADTIEKFKNWLSQNKPAVYYTLAEPKEIQLDLNPLELFENTNNITVESSVNPTLHIEYYKNTILNGIYATKGELDVSNREINLSVESSFGDVANQIDDLSGNLNSSISQLTLNESSIQASVTEIEKNLSDNTEKIKNMSSEFTTNGLRISSSQSDFNALFNNVGVQVFDRDKLTAIFNQNGSGVNKLIIVESMQFQNLLAQKREIDLNGTTKPVISFFWNNNLIETLEDLRGGN